MGLLRMLYKAKNIQAAENLQTWHGDPITEQEYDIFFSFPICMRGGDENCCLSI